MERNGPSPLEEFHRDEVCPGEAGSPDWANLLRETEAFAERQIATDSNLLFARRPVLSAARVNV